MGHIATNGNVHTAHKKYQRNVQICLGVLRELGLINCLRIYFVHFIQTVPTLLQNDFKECAISPCHTKGNTCSKTREWDRLSLGSKTIVSLSPVDCPPSATMSVTSSVCYENRKTTSVQQKWEDNPLSHLVPFLASTTRKPMQVIHEQTMRKSFFCSSRRSPGGKTTIAKRMPTWDKSSCHCGQVAWCFSRTPPAFVNVWPHAHSISTSSCRLRWANRLRLFWNVLPQ